MEVRRQLVSVEPSIQTVQKGGIVVIDSPRIELQEADGFFNVQLREVVDGCLGNPFITNGVIDIAIAFWGFALCDDVDKSAGHDDDFLGCASQLVLDCFKGLCLDFFLGGVLGHHNLCSHL